MHYSRPSDFAHFLLKEDARTVDIDSSEACRLAALSMARQAVRSIEIVSRRLDPEMYDNTDFCDALSQLVVGSRRARTRALLHHIDPVLRRGHRLVTLAHRLSSFIEIRVPAPEFHEHNSAFLIADGAGVIHRHLSDRFKASVDFNNPQLARELGRQFEDMWQTAVPDINLRRSHL